jgi:Meiotically up-regulated gene 113
MTEYVYLIGSKATSLVKIGRSTNVPGRLAALQSGSPINLAVLWQTKGGAELEAALHRHFKAQRTHGEWFDFPDRDAATQVVSALPWIKKARKIRQVWTAPKASRVGRPLAAFGGYAVGDVVVTAREGWGDRTCVVRHILKHEGTYLLAVEENDGQRHSFFPVCTITEITHQDTVPEMPYGDLVCCYGQGCMCMSPQRGLAMPIYSRLPPLI